MKDSNNVFKKAGLTGVGLCAACCLLPIAGLIFGMGPLNYIAGFLEWACIAAMTSAVIFFGVYLFKKRRPATCDIDCECKEDKQANVS